MDIIDLKNRISSVNDEIDYLKNEINEIVNDTSFTEEEKRYEIDILNQKISKKLELLNKYQKEQSSIEIDHDMAMINNLKIKAVKSLSGIVTAEQLTYYQNLLNTNDMNTLKSVLDSINEIVRTDYINKITNIESFDPNSPYRFVCHSISDIGFDVNQGYDGNYISCSILSNEQNDTYSSNFGLIYPPESIVAASSGDFAVNNNASSNDELLMFQLYPTIQNIDSIIEETVERKKSDAKEYNEVVIKKTDPIGIFYKGNYDELDSITKSNIDKLRTKYPNLKILELPTKIETKSVIEKINIVHPRAKELNELETQKQLAKQNNDEVAYNYAKSSIEKIIRESRLEVSPEQWDSMGIQDKIVFVKIKMNEARILNDQDEFNYWNSNLNSLNEKVQSSESKTEDIFDEKKSSLEDLKNTIGNTEGYVVLVHGTHMTNEEVQSMIFKEGLRTTNFNEKTTLDKTTKPFDISKYTSEEIKRLFENYDHNNKNMVVIKLPLEYFNKYDFTGDLDCRKTRAFMKDKIYIDGRYKYLLDPKFIVGSYNTETMETMLNPSFERELTVETKKELREKLIKLQQDIGLDSELIEQINSDEIVEVNQPTYSSVPTSGSNSNDYQEMIQKLETKKDYNYYFDEMLKATQQYNPNTQMTEEQKKRLIGEIFYNEDYLIESLSNDEELRQIMTRSVNELSNNEMQVKLQNIVLTEIQEKYKQLHPEKKEVEQQQNVQNTTENKNNDGLDLSVLIEQLRMELNQVQNAYRSMMLDGYIDDEELATLLGMVNKVINDGYSLKSLASDPSDLRVISVIINSLEEEQKKMNKMQNGIEEVGKSMR